ncbi:MAG: hypothetical protein ACOYJK_09355 [Prevotella sp.]|jgi:hypothetical protein
MAKIEKILLLLIIIISPFVIYALTKLLPTFDDWTYLTYPNEDPDFLKFILPYGNYWRPLDAIFGYVVAIDLDLFPALNHIVIYLGHFLGAMMIYVISRQLHFSRFPATIGAVFYFISPAMLGAVLGIDSINQIYSATFGLVALAFYLSPYKHRTTLWMVFCLLATFSKENGVMWIFIVPFIAYTFSKTDKATFRRHIVLAVGLAVVYAAVRLTLPHYTLSDSNKYLQSIIATKIANLAKLIVLTCCSTDFISLFHKPSRNLPFLITTTALSLPLLYVLLINNVKVWTQHKSLSLIVAALLAAAPHLLTLFSTMHAYAALGVVALLLAYIVYQDSSNRRRIAITFLLYSLSAVMVDGRHYLESYRSGMMGKKMAEQVITQSKHPAQKAFCISIDHHEQKYSSFCVIPYDAFGWGNAVYFYTRHHWPKVLKDEHISEDKAKCCLDDMISQKINEGYDHVWIVDGKQVKVVER